MHTMQVLMAVNYTPTFSCIYCFLSELNVLIYLADTQIAEQQNIQCNTGVNKKDKIGR